MCGALASGGSSRAVRSAEPGHLGERQVGRAFEPDDAGPGHAGVPGSRRYQELRRQEVPIVNAGVRCPGAQRGDDGGLLGRQVGGVVGLDVADGAVQVGAAAQRPVDDEQVVGGRVLGAERQRELHLGVGEPLLQGERQLVEPGPAASRAG